MSSSSTSTLGGTANSATANTATSSSHKNKYVPGSSVFRAGDRLPDTYETDYRAHYVAYPLDAASTSPGKGGKSTSKAPAAHGSAAAAANRSNLPFLDHDVPLTTDSRDHYKNYGDAYRPENMAKAHKAHHRELAFGYETEAINSVHRETFTTHELPPQKTRVSRTAGVDAMRRRGARGGWCLMVE
jgi:hypothetical protein